MSCLPDRHAYFDAVSVKAGRFYRNALAKSLGTDAGAWVYANTCGFIPGVERVRIIKEDDLFRYETRKESLCFPHARIPVKIFLMSMGYRNWLREKYRCAGFVEVEPGDTVIDCGAFAGGFSTAIADTASVVHAVEPSPRNFCALWRNIRASPNIRAHNIGLFDREGTLTLNLSSTCVDDSLLTPDAGATGQTVRVRARRVDKWAAEDLALERIDFLKVEAEGVETEIVKSMGDFPVRKLAVDCSPERDGVSNLEEIAGYLEGRGFSIMTRNWMVFARSWRMIQ